MKPITKAVAAYPGTRSQLADELGVTPQAVSQWVTGNRPVPAAHAPKIERLTNVRCEVLRPDLTWTRGTDGRVTGYHVSVAGSAAA